MTSRQIRFVAMVDRHGTLLATFERKGLKPLLNDEQTAQYSQAAVTRQYTRVRWQAILGKNDYTCSCYEKILRVTIPITDEKNHLEFVIIFTFDVDTKNYHSIIMKKILPFVRKSEHKFLENEKMILNQNRG
jgi:hypothetical protein